MSAPLSLSLSLSLSRPVPLLRWATCAEGLAPVAGQGAAALAHDRMRASARPHSPTVTARPM